MIGELSERKKLILKAVIEAHIETGEPVGSKYLMQYKQIAYSSATIRNEMAELEEMGYLEQPHTSAGRIPSDKGYRLYVDTMMEEKERKVEEMEEMLLKRQDKMETLLYGDDTSAVYVTCCDAEGNFYEPAMFVFP